MIISFDTKKKQELIDITERINEALKKSKVKSGLCHVFVRHTTAGVIINENDGPDVCIDILNALNKSFPDHAGYLHDKKDNNAGAHIKASILGSSQVIPFEDRKLKLGRWQAVMLVELDGPRKDRKIEISVIKTEA